MRGSFFVLVYPGNPSWAIFPERLVDRARLKRERRSLERECGNLRRKRGVLAREFGT
jgi:hypothetical protein